MLKSYSLKHELGDELFPLLKAYRDAVNSVLEELWNSIEWKKSKVNGKKQWRLLLKNTSTVLFINQLLVILWPVVIILHNATRLN